MENETIYVPTGIDRHGVERLSKENGSARWCLSMSPCIEASINVNVVQFLYSFAFG